MSVSCCPALVGRWKTEVGLRLSGVRGWDTEVGLRLPGVRGWKTEVGLHPSDTPAMPSGGGRESV